MPGLLTHLVGELNVGTVHSFKFIRDLSYQVGAIYDLYLSALSCICKQR